MRETKQRGKLVIVIPRMGRLQGAQLVGLQSVFSFSSQCSPTIWCSNHSNDFCYTGDSRVRKNNVRHSIVPSLTNRAWAPGFHLYWEQVLESRWIWEMGKQTRMPAEPCQRMEGSVCVRVPRGSSTEAGHVGKEEIELSKGPCKSGQCMVCPRNRSCLWPKKSKTVAQWFCFFLGLLL